MEIQEVANALMKMDEAAEAPEAAPVAPAVPETPPAEAPQESAPAPEAPPAEPAEPSAEPESEAAAIKAQADELERRLKAAEREQDRWRKQADYWMKSFQTLQPVQPKQPETPNQPPEPSPYPPKPVLSQFNDYDEYVENLTDWKLQKREIDARINIERQMQTRQQQEVQNFINTKMAEGLKKYPDEFWSHADEVGQRLTEDMRRVIFKADNFSELVMHLGKNLAEVERIATIQDPDDRAFELKSISRRIKTDAINLKQKETQQPAAVQKPGTPVTRPAFDEKKAIQKATETGSLRDWAKVIEIRENTPRRQ